MATVITSLGAGVTHDENVTISSVSGGGPTYTVTLSASVPASVVIGDAFYDEKAAPADKWLIEGISGSDLTVRDSTGVGAAPDDTSGSSTPTIQRYYNGSTPIVDWESELDDTNLYNASDDAVGECYNDAVFTSPNILINSGGGIGLTTAKLTTPSAERHDGTAGVGARIVADGANLTVAIGSPAITVQWIEIDSNHEVGASATVSIFGAGDNCTFQNSILHSPFRTTGSCAGLRLDAGTNNFSLNNLIIYDVENSGSAGDAIGISTSTTSGTSTILNITVHDVRITNGSATVDCKCFRNNDDAQLTLRNCISTDPANSGSGTAECYDLNPPSNATFDHNLSSDTTSSGTGSLDSRASGDQFISTTGGSEDLHLKVGADAILAGDDLGTTNGVNFDIDGHDRDPRLDVWDMGADQSPQTLLTSLGAGVTHDEDAVISGVSGSGPSYTVTIAANSSVDGDALWDEHATPRKYLITAGGGTTSLTVLDTTAVGSGPDNSGDSPSEIQRYYNGTSPRNNWETELDDTDLYLSGEDAVGECYNDAFFDEGVTINIAATVGLNSVTLTAASGEEHTGVAGTGARFVPNFSPGSINAQPNAGLTFSNIELDLNTATNQLTTSHETDSGDPIFFLRLLIYDLVLNGSVDKAMVKQSTGFLRMSNSILYNNTQTGTGFAGGIETASAVAAEIRNCTIHNILANGTSNISSGIVLNDVSNHKYQNIISTDTGGSSSGTHDDYDDSAPGTATVDHNLASDTTASGTNSLDSKASSDQFISTTGGSENLHLKTGADAIGAGDDFGTTNGVNFDIDGFDRDADVSRDPWDMGAHEFETVAGGDFFTPIKRKRIIYEILHDRS